MTVTKKRKWFNPMRLIKGDYYDVEEQRYVDVTEEVKFVSREKLLNSLISPIRQALAEEQIKISEFADNETTRIKEYFYVQKATLMLNFAPERIKHLKEVITYLNEIGATPKPAEPSEKKASKPASGNSRTGRTIIGETERGKEKESSADSQKRQTAKKSEGKTGRKQISEKVHSESDTSDRRSEPGFNVGIAMAVGGGAIAVAGAVTLKPVVVAAGVAVAGAGCAIISANRQK